MIDCEFDADCPGCMCHSRLPCTHCVKHLDEDGAPLVIHREDVTDADGAVDPRKVFAHPAPLARDIPVWVRPYGPDSPRLQSVADFLGQLPADELPTVTVELWTSRTDYLTAPCWWHWRPPCDCPDTSFGRRPHRWKCEQTPIWTQTMRDTGINPMTTPIAGFDGWVKVGALKDGDL